MDEDRSEAGGHPDGQGSEDADFIEAGEIAAEYEVNIIGESLLQFREYSIPMLTADTTYWAVAVWQSSPSPHHTYFQQPEPAVTAAEAVRHCCVSSFFF